MISKLGVNTPALSSHSTSANTFIFVKNTPANFEYPLSIAQHPQLSQLKAFTTLPSDQL